MILKQDLWREEKDAVHQFYETQYEPIIDDFSKRVGTNNVDHYVFPLCLIRSNLRDSNGNVIKSGSGTYDEMARREHTVYFLDNLRNIVRGS